MATRRRNLIPAVAHKFTIETAGQRPRIHVLAGVNGAGKSSIGGAAIRAFGGEYYNPDEAARGLTILTAWRKQSGEPFSDKAAMAKLYASEAANRAAYRAVQVHGGYGYSREYRVERLYRDARVLTLYEGTSEIQRLVIARNILKS